MEHNVLSLPSLQSIHGISLSLLSGIFASAAEFYQLAPWKLFQEEVSIEIRYPQDKPARIAVVTGMAGDVFGLTVYDSAADHGRMYSETDPMKLVHDISWLILCYDRAEYVAPEDLQVIEEHGWTVINEKAYPGIVRMGAPGADLHPPTKEDLLWLQGALPGLNVVFQKHFGNQGPGDLHPHEFVFTVQTLSEPAQIYMRIPAQGMSSRPEG